MPYKDPHDPRKIAIDLNGVVRDVFGKTAQTYEKFYIEELDDDTSS